MESKGDIAEGTTSVQDAQAQGLKGNTVRTESNFDNVDILDQLPRDNNYDDLNRHTTEEDDSDTVHDINLNNDVGIDTLLADIDDHINVENQEGNIIGEQTHELSIHANMTDLNDHEEVSASVSSEDHASQNSMGLVNEEFSIEPVFSSVDDNDSEQQMRTHPSSHTESTNFVVHSKSGNGVTDDIPAPPPDYEEYIITEFYRNHGLVCNGSQTLPGVCYCNCHSGAGTSNNLNSNTNQNLEMENSPQFYSNNQMTSLQPTAPFVWNTPDTNQQTGQTGTYQSGNDQNDKKFKYFFWVLILVIVVSGAVFGILAAFLY